MAAPMGHDRSRKPVSDNDDEDDDLVDKRLKEMGCMDKHLAVQDCMFDTKDWRKCQEQVKAFKACVENYEKQKKKT
ncbi:cytochrome c oxidase assembly factor 4 homolog, mitochondrial [Lingula anatina]|uniref:Cytochrome c oxidase assembly factor 4 homolog, mitochondrial n=1 Tax=Lingula anatina TaxID=7574 RepID=A0A1S3HLW4_LINAN|nr:cytochrome c oxidase assembly factor 4 homolog, mitochondrial [Lingula anatina]XP_013405745.1 cytochrome c oxidase assembly factor 4 homolog, mitochondrial [Lingula anatina]|eukprot:XP_013386476.1 cytochrome c oxidase assembly factor 4 homolog, mitochondrial [Lingula anatina]